MLRSKTLLTSFSSKELSRDIWKKSVRVQGRPCKSGQVWPKAKLAPHVHKIVVIVF